MCNVAAPEGFNMMTAIKKINVIMEHRFRVLISKHLAETPSTLDMSVQLILVSEF